MGAYLIADAAHPIGLVAGGAAPSPVPYADVVCATTHKVLRGPRGGMILCGAELAERVDRAVFPFTQGGAQMHSVAAKAVAFGEAATPAFTGYAHQVVANARVLADGLAAEGLVVTTGGTDTHLITADPGAAGVDGRTARAGSPPPDRARLLRAAPRRRPRAAARHRRGDHPGDGGGGDGTDRGAVRRGAAGARSTAAAREEVRGAGRRDFRRIRP